MNCKRIFVPFVSCLIFLTVDHLHQKTLTLRYRLVVHRGNSKQIDLDKLQKQYNNEKL